MLDANCTACISKRQGTQYWMVNFFSIVPFIISQGVAGSAGALW